MNKPLSGALASQPELAAHFVARLRSAMQENAITAAELARRTGLSKAAISQLMSERTGRLPNSYSIYMLARSLNRTVDYFLGSAVDLGEVQTTVFADLHDDTLDALDRLCREVMLAPDAGPCVLMADTLPDYLKTAATLEAEYGTGAAIAAHATRIEAIRSTPARPAGLVLCDPGVIVQLVRGGGLYRGMDTGARRNQIALMVDFFEARFPDLICSVAAFRPNGLGPALLYGRANVAAPVLGGVVQMTNETLFARLSARAQLAARRGVPLRQFVDLIDGV
jgi:transcriptional regulator with XRE-family HTH domain